MLTLLSDLAEIAQDVDAPGRDAVLLRVDRLRHAPTALEVLLHLVEHHDWRVLNLRHVREAAALGGALTDAKRLLRRLRRALVKLSEARGTLLESIARIEDSYRGFLLPDLAGFEALCAGVRRFVVAAESHQVGSGSLVAGIDSQLEAVRRRRPKMNFAIPSSFRRYDLYIDLNQSILFLRRAHEKVDRRLSRLHPVVAALQEQAARLEETTHGVSRPAPQTLNIARSLWTSTSALAHSAGNSTYNVLIPCIANHLELLRASLAAPLALPYEWFTGVINICSLRDIADLRDISRPLLDDEPSHRIHVVVGGVRALVEAQGMHVQLMTGVDERRWVVQGLPQLAQAVMLSNGLSALKVALDRAHRGNVYSADGEVIAPEYFDDVRERASEVQDIVDSDPTVISSGAPALLTRVAELLDNERQDKVFDVILELNAVQLEGIIFI
ncbi:hypothetical protein VPH35_016855 [Triticum aestivum]